MPNPVDIRLLVEPTRLRLDERDRFRVRLVAVNLTDAAIDPQLYAARLFVNGEPSPAFDLALNGVMPAGWDVLAAGQATKPVEWRLGEALFPEPGEYHLALRLEVAGWDPVEVSETVSVVAD